MPEIDKPQQTALRCIPLGWIVVCAGLLMIGTFDMPGREDVITTNNLDYLALFKIATRLGTIALFFPLVAFRARSILESRSLRVYVPWVVLLAWAGLSVLWSPLKAI